MYTAESSRATPKDGTHFDRVRFLARSSTGWSVSRSRSGTPTSPRPPTSTPRPRRRRRGHRRPALMRVRRADESALPGHRRGPHTAHPGPGRDRSGGGARGRHRGDGRGPRSGRAGQELRGRAVPGPSPRGSGVVGESPSRPTMRLVAATPFEQLTRVPAGRRSRFVLTDELIEALGSGRRAVVVDEAQRLTKDRIEFLRYPARRPPHPVRTATRRRRRRLVGALPGPTLRSRVYRRRVALGPAVRVPGV